MTFLAPLFLWLIPFTAIPLLIHLLNKRNIITVNFSTLKFLKKIENESIKKLHILQLLLLLIRTIIILLIIMMISRPIINSAFKTSNQSTYSVILIDDSFSSTTQIDLMKNTANKIINTIEDKNQLLWINTNTGIMYTGLKEDLPSIENLITKTYLSNPIHNSVKYILEETKDILITKELFILTDKKHSNIQEINKIKNDLDTFNIYAIIHPTLKHNLAITDVKIINEILSPNDEIIIEAYIENYGLNNISNKSLSLIINNMIVGQQLVSLNPGELDKFIFKTAVSEPGQIESLLELENDDENLDNKFYFNINIPKLQNIALISNSEASSFYFKESIRALNKYNPVFKLDHYTDVYDFRLDINYYDIILHLNPSNLKNINDSRLEEYIYNGGHFIIFPNFNNKDMSYSTINSIYTQLTDDYSEVNRVSLVNSSYQNIKYNKNIDELNYILDPSNSNLERIQIYEYLNLPFNENATKILTDNNHPVWNRYILQDGLLDIFGFSLRLNSTNFPLMGSFIPFTNFLLYSNTSRGSILYKSTNNKWIYKTDKFYNNLNHYLPNGKKKIINKTDNKYFSTERLDIPGFHSIHSKNDKLKSLSVNIDQREYLSNFTTAEIINRDVENVIKIIPSEDNIEDAIISMKNGHELWRYILYAIMILLIFEMIISNDKKRN